jgi:hypothetical protein
VELQAGDRVRVVIAGRETGEVGVVTDTHFNGRIKIRTGDVTKSYLSEELRPMADLDRPEDVEQTYLHIGDMITISASSKGFISAEGILDNKCFVKGEPTPFDNSLFRIAMKNRVAGAIDLEEYESNAAAESDGRNSELGDQMLSTLRRVKQNEAELNATLQIEKAGEPIQFGMVIQLRHINSGKWLTANTGAVAVTERESLECSLSGEVSKRCWFTVMPSSSLTSEGSKVENYVDLLLGESENGFLHASGLAVAKTSKTSAQKTPDYEANISMNPTVWKFQLYTAHYRAADQISCGTVVQFYDPMVDGYLRALGRRERELVGEDERECLVLSSQSDNRSSSMWVLERGTISQGGIIEHGDDLCFRHLASGKYMRLSSSKRGLTASLVSDRLYDGTRFAMRPMSMVDLTDEIVREGDQIVLQSGLQWLGHDAPTPEMSLHRAKATTKPGATCLIIRKADEKVCRETRALRASASVLEDFVDTMTSCTTFEDGLKETVEDVLSSATQLLPDFLKAIELCDQLIAFVTRSAVEARPLELAKKTITQDSRKKSRKISHTGSMSPSSRKPSAMGRTSVSALKTDGQQSPLSSPVSKVDTMQQLQTTARKGSSSFDEICAQSASMLQLDVDRGRQNLAREISIIDLVLDAMELLTKLSENGSKTLGVSRVISNIHSSTPRGISHVFAPTTNINCI